MLNDVVDGLRHIHLKKIIHGDLRPANILLEATES